ncbi:MAG: dethiobiotin synthase [Nonlabens sp.]|nr:dethiobiotin synthase [Nonlabens sp.]
MDKQHYFITGISTDVGKTIVAAIVAQALKADYWKPIQTGAGGHGDAREVRSLISNDKTAIHPESIVLKAPMSPHAAAMLENITLDIKQVKRPETTNSLVIEGAGGLLVPINNKHTVMDLIAPNDKVILVSAGYLGSINHTLLSLEVLKNRGLTCAGIIYNQVTLDGTIEVIEAMTGIPTLGHLEKETNMNSHVISRYAAIMRDKLLAL